MNSLNVTNFGVDPICASCIRIINVTLEPPAGISEDRVFLSIYCGCFQTSLHLKGRVLKKMYYKIYLTSLSKSHLHWAGIRPNIIWNDIIIKVRVDCALVPHFHLQQTARLTYS